MALLINLATKTKRAPLVFPLLLKLIIRPGGNPSFPFSPGRPCIPLCFASSVSKSDFPYDPSFPLGSSPNHYRYETSDYETEESETVSSDPLALRQFIELLKQTKQLSISEEAISFLKQSGMQPTEEVVYAMMWELRNEWKLAFLAFRWGGTYLSNTQRCWNFMTWILAKKKKFNIAWQLVLEMHRLNVSARKALLIMIKGYAAANEPGKAVRTFHAFEKFKITADTSAFFILLSALCKHKNIEEAEELMFLNKKLFPLGTESFNIILDGWCNILVDVNEAKRIWREMSNCCIHPDGTSYTHMICCSSKVGNLFDSLRLYDEMKKKGSVPGILVYNSLIFILTKDNCMKEARNLLKKIVEAGLEPNADTYNSIIYPLCEANKLEEARNVLDEMITQRVKPTAGTFHALVKVENMGRTLKLIDRMKEVGCDPNASTFLLIFDKFFRWGLPGDVLRMWSVMGKHNVIPHLKHYVMLVEGLAKCGWLNKAREYYHDMKAKGFSEDPRLERILRGSKVSNRNREQSRYIKGEGL
ncbi:pentatricopeptide repeat-containing protein At1g80880, mitochondrial [Aristolochia californica]|uniref:pentatricopeptide repeat-containing protein At1g80880, mitochondrial n=1 Tax=Aristolochia californica TaxID=171875 RepID=UPI0035E0B36A